MKKKIFMLLALFAGVLSASADNTISVKKVYITPGGVASFGIDLDNTDDLCGFTMFLTLPDGISLNGTLKCGEMGEAGFAINKTARTQGELVDPNPNGTNRYGLGYISTKVLPGNTGAIIQVNIEAASTLAPGTVLSGTIDNITFGAMGSSSDIVLPNASFEIEVADQVVLDEESTSLPATQEDAVDVLVKRDLKGGIWNTICLPFKMTKTQVTDAFGTGVQVAEIEEISSEAGVFTVKFKSRTASNQILANKVYIVKPTADCPQFEINTTVTPVASPKTVYEDPDEGIELGTAYGTLYAGAIIPKDNIFISNNSFYYSKGSTVIKGFRGYFKLEGFTTSSPAPVFMVDGEATNIEGLQILTDDGQYYNLKGQKVDNPTEKGVYIQNGKKVVVK